MKKDTYYSSKSLTFELINADIEIKGADIEQIEYEIKETANISISKDAGGLYFVQKPVNSIFGILAGMGIEITVYVPEYSILDDIDINSKGKSDVLISNVQALNYEHHSLSGDIKIEECHIEKMYVKTVDGDIELISSEADDVYMANTSGDVKIKDANGRIINIASTSGDVEIENLDAASISVRTVSGDIDVEIDGRSEDYHIISNTINTFKEYNSRKERKLDLSTVSGEIDYTFMD